MEFLINFKTIMEAHLVPSQSWTRVWKHRVPIPIQDTAMATKISLFKPKKKKETMKHGNTETGSGTAFPRLYFQDCISGTAVPRLRESGLHFWDHGNRDFILNIMEAGSHFFNYGNKIKFLISWNQDCISDITGVGTAFLRSRDRVCTPEITGMVL